jgi:hypothetical protein
VTKNGRPEGVLETLKLCDAGLAPLAGCEKESDVALAEIVPEVKMRVTGRPEGESTACPIGPVAAMVTY